MGVTNCRPAPAWLRDVDRARATYRELAGVGAGRAAKPGGRGGPVLVAVAMPAALGARVRAHLGMSIMPAPVIANSAGTRWTFLAKSGSSVRPEVADELAESMVYLAPRGSYVVVPTGLGADGPAERWIESPRPNRPLPAPSSRSPRRLTHGIRPLELTA